MLPKILDNAHITEDQPRAKQGKYEIKFNWFRHRGYKIIIDHNSIGMVIRVQRIFFLFNFYSAHTFFFVFFNSKNNLFSYIF